MITNFNYSKENIRQIENLLPRLKYSILPTHIIRWLENFEKDDIPLAIDLLRMMEYISFSEFMSRLDMLLRELFKQIPIGDKILIFPYGKIGKSGTLVTYPLRNTKAFKKRIDDITISQDFKYIIDPKQYKHIVFIDDFIGSGRTFCRDYISSGIANWIDDNQIQNSYILVAIIMHQGKLKINSIYPEIKIIAEERHKIFDKDYSPFVIYEENKVEEIKLMTLKYGNQILVTRPPNGFRPLGYDKSESLISFFHGTPNNTLSIIWGESKNWHPLYARSSEVRMSQAKNLKKELKYYLSFAEKIGINIYYGDVIMKKLNDYRTTNRRMLREQNHAAIILLYLISKGYQNIFICQILGLSREELLLIYNELKIKQLITNSLKITVEGNRVLYNLNKVKKRLKNRNETKENLQIKKTIYLPKMFKGNT